MLFIVVDFITGALIASSGLNALGALFNSQAQARAARYNAAIGERNAQLAERDARDALANGLAAVSAQRARTTMLVDRQLAAQAANGLDVSFGSALDVRTSTAFRGETDAQTLRKNAFSDYYQGTLQAYGYRSGAALDRATASGARVSGFISGAGHLASGFGDAAYYNYRRNRGIFGGEL